jgi:hypothetical protein
MQARTSNLLAVALAAALFSPLALAQSVQGAVNGAAHGQAQLPTAPAVPQAPTLPTQASTRADTAVSAAMQNSMPPPADGTQMQQPQTAVDAQVKGAEHAQAHSAVAARDVFGKLDVDGDGKISATEASADADFNGGFSAMDGDGDGFVTDAEFRAHAKADMPEQP